MADKYTTGHVPKLSFEELVRRANANAFFLPDTPVTGQPTKLSKRRKKKKQKMTVQEMVAQLSEEQLEELRNKLS